MPRVGTVIASVSRYAGGLFDAVRGLTNSVLQIGKFDAEVYGLCDKFSEEDKGTWLPMEVKLVDVVGPRSFGFAPRLYESLCAGKLDIIHNHSIWMYPSIAVQRCARNQSIPYVVSPHGALDPWAVRNSAWKKRMAKLIYEDGHLSGARCLRALCPSEANAMRAFGVKNPICVVPNGVDMPLGYHPARPSWSACIPEGKRILLYLGRLHPKKGLPNLIKAWSEVANDDWHLVIAGWNQGDHEQELIALAGEVGAADSISFVGPQFGDAKRDSYGHAQASILPSFSEGMPMAVLEAWSNRLPVIMTSECNLREGFECGAAIEVLASEESIGEGLRTLFQCSDRERKSIGSKGYELVAARFSWPTIGRQMTSVYEWIVGGGPVPSCVRLD